MTPFREAPRLRIAITCALLAKPSVVKIGLDQGRLVAIDQGTTNDRSGSADRP